MAEFVYKFNVLEIGNLFRSHNLAASLCEQLSSNGFAGAEFEKLTQISDDELQFKNYLKGFLKDELHGTTSESDFLHLKAIAKKFRHTNILPNGKIIHDVIHGQITLHPLLVKIINTFEFQRLRHLKQTGMLNYVYPSSNHSRFEHSIGTSYIAGRLIDHLKEGQSHLSITAIDCLCIRIAALIHDCGHGPFSHLFESVIKRLNIQNWNHETMSLLIIERIYSKLVDEFNSYGVFADDLEFIKDLIHIPEESDDQTNYTQKISSLNSLKKRGIEKSFMYEIVANKRNGIDVDKFDYLERDSYYLGFKNNFDYNRYIKYSKVIKCEDGLNQICLREKEFSDIYEMFHIRERLHRLAYQHEVTVSIELMLVAALVKANDYYKFSDIVRTSNIGEYLKLNDSIYLEIMNSNDSRLAESKEILTNIESRNLLKYISGTILKQIDNIEAIKHNFLSYLNDKLNMNNNFNTNDVCLSVSRFNYGANDLNPIENVRFYNKYQPNSAFPIKKKQVSSMLISVFEDLVLRVYSKNIDLTYRTLLYTAFCEWCTLNGFSEPYSAFACQPCNMSIE